MILFLLLLFYLVYIIIVLLNVSFYISIIALGYLLYMYWQQKSVTTNVLQLMLIFVSVIQKLLIISLVAAFVGLVFIIIPGIFYAIGDENVKWTPVLKFLVAVIALIVAWITSTNWKRQALWQTKKEPNLLWLKYFMKLSICLGIVNCFVSFSDYHF